MTTGHIGVVNHGVPNEVRGANGCGYSQNIVSEVYGPLGCYYDPSRAPGVESIPDEKTWNAFAKGTVQLNDNWQADLTGIYAKDESHLIIQPGPISNVFTFGPDLTHSTITLQPTSPFYPHAEAAAAGVDGQPLNVRYRTYENGNRDTTDTNEHGQLIASVHGSVKDWDVDASVYYAEGKTTEHVNGGFQDYRLLMPLLNSGTVNLFGFNTPAVVQELRATNFIGDAIDGKSKKYGANAKASGEIFKLPAGPVSLAFGGDTYKDKLTEVYGDRLPWWIHHRLRRFTRGCRGLAHAVGDVCRDQRPDREDAGRLMPRSATTTTAISVRTTNPKVSLRWQPTKALLFRSSWGTGFLAPSLFELFSPNTTAVTASGLSDPIRCPVTGNTGVDCRTQFGALFGGNANLKPEKSEQFTAGMVIEPIAGTSLSVDYFKLNLKNFITDGVAPSTILGDLAQVRRTW